MYSAFHPTRTARFLIKWKQLLTTTPAWAVFLGQLYFYHSKSHGATVFPSSTQQNNGPLLIRSIPKEPESKLI